MGTFWSFPCQPLPAVEGNTCAGSSERLPMRGSGCRGPGATHHPRSSYPAMYAHPLFLNAMVSSPRGSPEVLS